MNEEIASQVEKVEQVPQGDKVPTVKGGNDVPVVPLELTNREIREAMLALARAVTT